MQVPHNSNETRYHWARVRLLHAHILCHSTARLRRCRLRVEPVLCSILHTKRGGTALARGGRLTTRSIQPVDSFDIPRRAIRGVEPEPGYGTIADSVLTLWCVSWCGTVAVRFKLRDAEVCACCVDRGGAERVNLGQIESWCVITGKVVMAHEFKVGGLEVRNWICGEGVLESETG